MDGCLKDQAGRQAGMQAVVSGTSDDKQRGGLQLDRWLLGETRLVDGMVVEVAALRIVIALVRPEDMGKGKWSLCWFDCTFSSTYTGTDSSDVFATKLAGFRCCLTCLQLERRP
jgi:hypothetical protein